MTVCIYWKLKEAMLLCENNWNDIENYEYVKRFEKQTKSLNIMQTQCFPTNKNFTSNVFYLFYFEGLLNSWIIVLIIGNLRNHILYFEKFVGTRNNTISIYLVWVSANQQCLPRGWNTRGTNWILRIQHFLSWFAGKRADPSKSQI